MPKHQALQGALSSLAACNGLRNAGALLDAGTPKVAMALREAVLTEVPAFSARQKLLVFADTIIWISVHRMRQFQAISLNIRQHGAQILSFQFCK